MLRSLSRRWNPRQQLIATTTQLTGNFGSADEAFAKIVAKYNGTGDDFLNLDFGADFKIGDEWTIGLDYGATLAQSGGSVPQQVRINIGAKF